MFDQLKWMTTCSIVSVQFEELGQRYWWEILCHVEDFDGWDLNDFFFLQGFLSAVSARDCFSQFLLTGKFCQKYTYSSGAKCKQKVCLWLFVSYKNAILVICINGNYCGYYEDGPWKTVTADKYCGGVVKVGLGLEHCRSNDGASALQQAPPLEVIRITDRWSKLRRLKSPIGDISQKV